MNHLNKKIASFPYQSIDTEVSVKLREVHKLWGLNLPKIEALDNQLIYVTYLSCLTLNQKLKIIIFQVLRYG